MLFQKLAGASFKGPSDPNFSSVTLLLAGDGANNSTTIIDSSLSSNSMTVGGNAKISTSVVKFGTGSIAFDGASDSVTSPDSTNFAFGTGSYTLEFWVYYNNVTSNQLALDLRKGSFNNSNISVYLNGSTNKLIVYQASTVRITSTNSLSANTWYHVAVTRSSNTTRLFINGVLEGSTWTDTTNYSTSTAVALGIDRFGSAHLNGYLDDVRVTKGVARYTSAFTPPTEAFPTN